VPELLDESIEKSFTRKQKAHRLELFNHLVKIVDGGESVDQVVFE
jgi:hypothetical protein